MIEFMGFWLCVPQLVEGVEAPAALGKINKFQGRLWEEARSEPLLVV